MAVRRRGQSAFPEMENTKIYLFRHSEVVGFTDGKVWGDSDVGITKLGKRQIEEVVSFMRDKKLSAVYSSDLQRTMIMADAIAKCQKHRMRVRTNKAFRELNLGGWEGLTLGQIDRKYPGELQARMDDLAGYRIKNGESLNDLSKRVMPAFWTMVKAHPREEICLVAHAGVNRVILCELMGANLDNIFRLDQSFACMNVIDIFSDGIPVIRAMNAKAVNSNLMPKP